ncbi:MAG: OPT/YSL family transporter [Phycisphaerales bacterium]|nr:OPT/YSL family transporter [Phycisphaerales bacterium]
MSNAPGPQFDPQANRGAKYREVTAAAIIFGLLIGIVINAAIAYAGLKIGFTIVGSPIAAVLGFGVLRGILRKGSILEVNITQTVGSSIDTVNSGIIFTVPVLLLLGYTLSWSDPNFWVLTASCVAGVVLGVAFIIPLRKQMIEIDRLRFPSGTAVAAILKSPGAGPKKAIVLLSGIAIAMLIRFPVALPALRFNADIGELDRLVDAGKISERDRATTLAIQDWIDAGGAPPEVVALGRTLDALSEARADAAKDPSNEAAAERVEALEAEAAGAPPEALALTPSALMGAFEASSGERSWSSLRSRRAGWATKPLWGYSDLGLRLPERRLADGTLNPEVDHDGDGVPDLVLDNEHFDLGRLLGIPSYIFFVLAITPLSLGAGYLSGKPGLMVLAGGVLAYFVLNPVAYRLGFIPPSVEPHQAPDVGRIAFNRPLGIGLLLGGAMMGVLSALPAMRAALKSIARGSKTVGGASELGLKTITIAILGAILVVFLAADYVHKEAFNRFDPVNGAPVARQVETAEHMGYAVGFATEETAAEWASWDDAQRDAYMASQNAKPGWLSGMNPHVKAAIIALVGVAWIWFAGIIIAQCTGMTDWSPISGMALLTVVLVLLLGGTGDVIAGVLLGATLCVAITIASDMMQDLKTGHMIGATPRKQQMLELSFTGIGPIVSMVTILIIAAANMEKFGVAIGPGTDTTAPQAQALAAVITGVQGGEMPYMLYGAGAALGVLLGFGAFAGLGVLVGLSMYLPFQYILTYGIGCLLNMAVTRVKGRGWSEEWGVPLCAGLVVGEALLDLGVNGLVLLMS